MTLETVVEDAVKTVPNGLCFDTHTIILILFKNRQNEFLQFASHFPSSTNYYARIGKIIGEINDHRIKSVGKSFSWSLAGEFLECECWKKE